MIAILAGFLSGILISAAYGSELAILESPPISTPKAGSLSGSLTSFDPSLSGLTQGELPIELPIDLPLERGPLGIAIQPTYQISNGISEWGMGFKVNLMITRTHRSGHAQFNQEDYFVTPFGILRLGDDGFYYGKSGDLLFKGQLIDHSFTIFLAGGDSYHFGAEYSRGPDSKPSLWHLSQVTTKTGRQTTFHWRKNASGRYFLFEVYYGGIGSDYQYRLEFDYQETDPPYYVSFRYGVREELDRYIKSLKVSISNQGDFEDLFSYRFQITPKESSYGFYLTSLKKVYPSGESEPDISFQYASEASFWDNPQLKKVENYESFWSEGNRFQLGFQNIQMLDYNQDGWLDFLNLRSRQLLIRNKSGFTMIDGDQNQRLSLNQAKECRDLGTKKLSLARITGPRSELSFIKITPLGTSSLLSICSLQGQLTHEEELPLRIDLETSAGIVDLNLDGKDDLIVIKDALYRIENISTENSIKFQVHSQALPYPTLRSIRYGDQIVFHDMNADGLLDLVSEHSSGLTILYNSGQFQFEEDPSFFPYLDQYNQTSFRDLSYLAKYGDLNRDGLTDLIFYNDSHFYPLINTGDSLRHQPLTIEGLEKLAPYQPSLADYSGKGDQQISFISKAKGLWKVDLTEPATGLLKSYSDGKGNQIKFSYQRGPKKAGIGVEKIVIKKIEKSSVGHKKQTWNLVFSEPKENKSQISILGYGFTTVTKGPMTSKLEHKFYPHENPLLLSKEEGDQRVPGWAKRTKNHFEPFDLFGLRFHRPKATQGQWFHDGLPIGALSLKRIDSYHFGNCIQQTTDVSQHGELTTRSNLYPVFSHNFSLSCLPSEISEEGSHDDQSLDFHSEKKFTYNRNLQLMSMLRRDGEHWQEALKISYDPKTHLPKKIKKVDHGTLHFHYDKKTYTLASMTHPDGSRELWKRNPRDQITFSLISRGGEKRGYEGYSFDSLNRLSAQWSSYSRTSLDNPLRRFHYTYPTFDHPGMLETTNLNASNNYYQIRSISSGSNKEMLRLTSFKEDHHWVEPITAIDLTKNRTTRYRPRLHLGAVDLSHFMKDFPWGDPLSTTEHSGFYPHFESKKTWQEEVKGRRFRVLDHDGNNRVLLINDDSNLTQSKTLGFFDETLAIQDPSDATWQYVYDAHRRIRRVFLPGEESLHLDLDPLGRKHRIRSSKAGQIEFHYHKGSNLLSHKRFYTLDGKLDRTISFSFDAMGRLLSKVFHHPSGTRKIVWSYDGKREQTKHQVGFLTGIYSEDFIKNFTYDLDGKVTQSTLTLPSLELTLFMNHFYHDNGKPKGIELIVRHPVKTLTYRKELSYDPLDRLTEISTNDEPMARITYQMGDRPDQVIFPGTHRRISFTYDPLTLEQTGYQSSDSKYSFSLNSQGLIEAEQFDLNTRSYTYSDRGFLEQVTGQKSDFYPYDLSGLPLVMSEKSDQSIQLSREDRLGRLISKGHLKLRYGADGNLVHSQNKAREARYIYDENDHRLASIFKDMTLVELGSLTLIINNDDAELYDPLSLSGYSLGMFTSNGFVPHDSDMRGSVMRQNSFSWAGPFGTRETPLSKSEILDFVHQKRDPVTGFIRFGKRDYDPKLRRFISPDPLFLESPKLCTTKPIECNLYSYARNNPLNYADPSGLVTIIVTGTWAQNENWGKKGSAFARAVSATFKETNGTNYFTWSGGNDASSRSLAAKGLADFINSHDIKSRIALGEKLNIVAHSHGGNVIKEYTHLPSAQKIDTLVNLGTPQRSDYSIDSSKVEHYYNAYSSHDRVQTSGFLDGLGYGSPMSTVFRVLTGPGDGPQSAGRIDPSATNIQIPTSGSPLGSHTELHTPGAWEYVHRSLNP